MDKADLVFSINEDKIMSAGFNINSLLLKEQINTKLENYMVPVGLAYKEDELRNGNNDYSSSLIDSDIYDKLVEFASQSKKKKNTSKKHKTKKNNKTNKIKFN